MCTLHSEHLFLRFEEIMTAPGRVMEEWQLLGFTVLQHSALPPSDSFAQNAPLCSICTNPAGLSTLHQPHHSISSTPPALTPAPALPLLWRISVGVCACYQELGLWYFSLHPGNGGVTSFCFLTLSLSLPLFLSLPFPFFFLLIFPLLQSIIKSYSFALINQINQ